MMTQEQLYTAALLGVRDDIYQDMFDSTDSDIVLELLRNFHASQSTQSIKQLVAQLDKMLHNQIIKELQ